MRRPRLFPSGSRSRVLGSVMCLAGVLAVFAVLPSRSSEACEPRGSYILKHGNRYRVVIFGHHGMWGFTPRVNMMNSSDVSRMYLHTKDYGFARFLADSRYKVRDEIGTVLVGQGPRVARSKGGLAKIGLAVARAMVRKYYKVSRRRVPLPRVKVILQQ